MRNTVLSSTCLAALVLLSCGSEGAPEITVGNLCASAYGDACGRSCTDACPLGLRCVSAACTADCTPSAGCSGGLACSLAGICGNPMPGVAGTPCAPDGQCPSGYVCDGRACRPRCGASHPCAVDELCSTEGICLKGVILGDATPTDDALPVLEDGCIHLNVPVERQTPTVLLLVDQSATMATAFGDAGATRFTLVRDALLSAGTGVVRTMQSDVRFGLTLYTNLKGGTTCPVLTTVGPRLSNYDAIQTTWTGAGPIQDTPTAAAIRATLNDLATVTDPGPKYILLVTDGLPDTCEDADPASAEAQEAANQTAVQAAAAAYAAGVGVIVMGVSSDIAPTHLAQMANAGAGLDPKATPGAPYYVASEAQADLATQFGAIVGTVRSCVLMLNGTVTAQSENRGVVKLGDRFLVYGDANGYKLDTPSQVELLGSACDTFRAGSTELGISFPCDAFIPR